MKLQKKSDENKIRPGLHSKLGGKVCGMVFGVFDDLHLGHEFFLSEVAKECVERKCSKLIVVVTLPEVVSFLKKKLPRQNLEERLGGVETFFKSEKFFTSKTFGNKAGTEVQFSVIPGDKEIGSWKVLKAHKPNVIFLGYDQQAIAKELDKLKRLASSNPKADFVGDFSYKFIESFMPEKYKSSLRKGSVRK